MAKSPDHNSASEFKVVEYAAGKEGFQDAANYDRRRYGGPASHYKQTVTMNAMMKLIGPLEGKRILDIGCGTGRGIVKFAQYATYAVGSDYSLDMLSYARQKVGEKSNCTFVRAIAQQLPFSGASFDVVTALNFLHLFDVGTQRAYKRWFRDERGSFPWEIRQAIGENCRIAKQYAAMFPIVWRVMYRFPRLFVPLEQIGYFPPFNHLLHRIYCKIITDSPS